MQETVILPRLMRCRGHAAPPASGWRGDRRAERRSRQRHVIDGGHERHLAAAHARRGEELDVDASVGQRTADLGQGPRLIRQADLDRFHLAADETGPLERVAGPLLVGRHEADGAARAPGHAADGGDIDPLLGERLTTRAISPGRFSLSTMNAIMGTSRRHAAGSAVEALPAWPGRRNA